MIRSIWDELEDMNRRFDETFGSLPTFPIRRFFGYLPMLPAVTEKPFVPTTEVFTHKGDLVVRLELPGIDPERDMKVTLEDGELVIRGERQQVKEVKETTYYRMETLYGTFERHFPVPEKLDEKAIHAEYKDGILEVVVKGAVEVLEAKKEKAKAIPVLATKETRELVAKA